MQGDPSPKVTRRRKDEWDDALRACIHPPGQSTGAAHIELRQVSDRLFELGSGLRFLDVHGRTDLDETITPEDLEDGETDLTSVPRALTWFVGKYGRHTPAALIHDALLDRATKDHERPLPYYEAADRKFLTILGCLGVPPLRRVMMWGAVSLGTRLRAGGMATWAVRAWLLAFTLGTVTLIRAAADGNLALIVVALLAPMAGAGLWGRQYWAGVVASYSAVFIAVPTIAGAVTYLVYQVLETAVGVVLWLTDRLQVTDTAVPRPSPTQRPYTGM